MTTEIKRGQHWRHKKRGTVYEIVNTEAMAQCSQGGEGSSPDMNSLVGLIEDEPWVAYHPVGLSPAVALYFRMKEEFLDGRFELVKEADA